MNLIIKPTEACNFACTFCSSSYLVDDKKVRLNLQYIYDFLKRFPQTKTIFVVGGDPLMMPTDYYQKILKHIRTNNYECSLSLTTNLWDFYKYPEKWIELFRDPLVEVSTSFQYGTGRQITPGKVFTEEMFTEIFRMFRRYVPEKELTFIAVIDKHNESFALDHVLLAKRLSTQCRLVYANSSGKATEPYTVANMVDFYIKIWKMGLSKYEQSCYAFSQKLKNIPVGCSLDRSCDSTMRSLNPDGRYFSCGPLNDDLDKENEIDFKKEMEGEFFKPIQESKYKFLKEECLGCNLFEVCNGCNKHIKDLVLSGKVEENCRKMKSISSDFIEMAKSKDMRDFNNGKNINK